MHPPDRRGRCARWTRPRLTVAAGPHRSVLSKNSHGMEALATVRAGQPIVVTAGSQGSCRRKRRNAAICAICTTVAVRASRRLPPARGGHSSKAKPALCDAAMHVLAREMGDCTASGTSRSSTSRWWTWRGLFTTIVVSIERSTVMARQFVMGAAVWSHSHARSQRRA